jgi:hypothetical protein
MTIQAITHHIFKTGRLTSVQRADLEALIWGTLNDDDHQALVQLVEALQTGVVKELNFIPENEWLEGSAA